jgi:hypothetical protein
MNLSLNISIFSLALLAGCASAPESVSVEHRGKVTIVHHRSRSGKGAIDRIDAIAANGTVTQATIHVYDLGRMPDGNGGMHEAHRYYQVTQSEHFDLRQPAKSSRSASGPRTVYMPPNYSAPPRDQRINDAVAEAKQAKQKLDEARANIDKQLANDNNLRGELQTVEDENQRLRDQISASMNTPQHGQKPAAETDAQKAAESATSIDSLTQWGQKLGNQ